MDNIRKELLTYNPNFSQQEIDEGLSLFELRTFPANTIVTKAGEVCDYILFAESSITRCFYKDHEGQNQTLWMKPEKTFLTEFKSFSNRDKSQFSLQFYEETTAYMISRDNLMQLYKTSQNWALFGISLMERCQRAVSDVIATVPWA